MRGCMSASFILISFPSSSAFSLSVPVNLPKAQQELELNYIPERARRSASEEWDADGLRGGFRYKFSKVGR